MKEVISIQVFFILNIFVIFLAVISAANCPAKPLLKTGLKVNCYMGNNTTNSVSCFDSIEVDTKANITCNYGNQNAGDLKIQKITCQNNSEWSEEPMNCEDVLSNFNNISGANCPAKPLHNIGLKVNCYIGNTTYSVSCFDSIIVDTKANITCKYGYQNSGDIKVQEITCQNNSKWSEEPMNCEDVCVDNTDAVTTTFVNNKIESVLSQTPWHVSILIDTRKSQIYNFKTQCNGVILNAKLILTAHACMRPFSPYEMVVIAGKFKRPINSIELYAKKSGVKKIYTNYNFTNNGIDFQETTQLAILELIQPLEYTKFVRSACLDWSTITDEVFNSNPVGFAALWDDFANCGFHGDLIYVELNTKELPGIVNHDKCSYGVKNPFDIFCYKSYNDQKDFCYPRPGTGIMLKQQLKDGSTKKLLWGLALHAYFIPPGNIEPRYTHNAIFFNVWHQRDFIIEYMEKFKTSNVLSYEFKFKPCPTVDFYKKKLLLYCEYNFVTIRCLSVITPGTIVRIKCKQGYEKPKTDKPDEIKCLEEGIWSDEFYQCEQVCGKLEKYTNDKASLIPLIRGGLEINAMSVPWQVAIYANNTSEMRGKWTLICGGTLTHKNIVISAAHCFWDSSINAAFHPSSFLVATGKRYAEYDVTEPYEQYSRILDISIPTTFNTNTLRSDIAVLILEKKFLFNSHTKPACLSWSSYGNYDYKSGIMGLVSGWGSTSEVSTRISNELRMIKIPTVEASSCRHLVDPEYKEYISGGKFCAQGSLGETACSGDSGGGFLAPQIDEDGIERYYLIGVVNSGVNPAKHCTENFVSIYTNIQYHQDIIRATADNNTES